MRKITLIVVLIACAAVGYAQNGRSMRQKIAVTSVSRNSFPVNPAAVIFTDNMNGDNSIAGLVARGYTTYWRGTGVQPLPADGSPEWYQGDTVNFITSYNGPAD